MFCFKRGIVMFQGAKNLAVNRLPLERGLAVQMWTSNRKPDSKAMVTWLFNVRGSREMPKNLDRKVSIGYFHGKEMCKAIVFPI